MRNCLNLNIHTAFSHIETMKPNTGKAFVSIWKCGKYVLYARTYARYQTPCQCVKPNKIKAFTQSMRLKANNGEGLSHLAPRLNFTLAPHLKKLQ